MVIVDINDFWIHDTVILSVFEDTELDTLSMSVNYPVNWEAGEYAKKRLLFTNAFNYQVHEFPFAGSPTILSAEVIEKLDRWTRIRFNTNAGYREVSCESFSLVED